MKAKSLNWIIPVLFFAAVAVTYVLLLNAGAFDHASQLVP